jgi:hypothetical protein
MIRQGEEELDANGIDTSLFSYDLPERAATWVKKYGITDAEIRFYKIAWCDLRQTLVFPFLRDERVVLTNERYFGPNPKHPKYLTFGNKSKEVVYLCGAHNTDKLVFVEDFVSAIKVRRLVSTMPLLGATIPEIALPWCKGRFKKIGVWLDFNKAAESMREASKAAAFVPATSIVTIGDPKELSMNQIDKALKEYHII